MRLRILTCALLLALPLTASAELLELKIQQRTPFADGKAFGKVGSYTMLRGIARYALDPRNPVNRFICDLDHAPRNAQGKVEFAADFCILLPEDPTRGNGALLYDVNNRGNKLALRMFNDAPGGNAISTAADAGNGFLMEHGFTVVWCGWIGELLAGSDRLLLQPPIATDNGKPIRGIVRYEMTSDTPTQSMPLSRREGHGSYTPTEQGEAAGTLTVRERETDERKPVPRAQWKLERLPLATVKDGVPGTLPQIRLHLKDGFKVGHLYELICEAENPIVQGVGFTAMRDLVSFLRYDISERNPLRSKEGKPVIQRTHGFGVSQSGRFLRTYLYLGANVDEAKRKVFDGLMPHVAGGGLGFFNHRFAQPTRHNAQHEEHLYWADQFPFTYGDEMEYRLAIQRTEGILRKLTREHPDAMPKIMHTQSAAEYWHRSGSLPHTNVNGTYDAVLPANVRLYSFGGTQHGPAAYPPPQGICQNKQNPGDYRPFLRALLVALDQWVATGKEPPASVYPKLKDQTLVTWEPVARSFPRLPGVRYPEVIQRPSGLDFGPDFERTGIITREPPATYATYTVLVPKSDKDGNDLGCLLPPEVAMPLATYTGWNLRKKEVGAENMLASLMGSFIPFAQSKAERMQTGDPRQSIEERYGNFGVYEKAYAAVCQRYQEQRLLLPADVTRMSATVGKYRALFGGQ